MHIDEIVVQHVFDYEVEWQLPLFSRDIVERSSVCETGQKMITERVTDHLYQQVQRKILLVDGGRAIRICWSPLGDCFTKLNLGMVLYQGILRLLL